MTGTPANQTDRGQTVTDEDAAFLAICRNERDPDAASYLTGWNDHAAGKQFHEGPQPFHTVKALSWRIGWNQRALEHRT